MTELADDDDDVDRLTWARTAERDRLSYVEMARFVRAIVLSSRTSPEAIAQPRIPEGYLALAEVEKSLDRRMWAGFGTAELAKQRLREGCETGKRTAGFEPRRADVRAALENAFLEEKLTLCVAVDETRGDERFTPVPAWAQNPIPVPKQLLGHVFVGERPPGNLSSRMPGNFAIPPRIKAPGSDPLCAMLSCGQLVVRESEYRQWLRSVRRKGKWPSQKRAGLERKPVGRPSKLQEPLENAILSIVEEQVWNGKRPLTVLHRLLGEKGFAAVSVDTVARRVDRLFAETGTAGLQRRHRIRRR